MGNHGTAWEILGSWSNQQQDIEIWIGTLDSISMAEVSSTF
jgi:hypothetical protein